MVVHSLLPLPDFLWVMEALYLVKTFNIEFSPDVHVLRHPESKKKMVFENWSVPTYVCVYKCNCVGNIQHFISPKLINIKTPNIMQQYLISVL